MTLRQLAAEPPTLPTRTTWYLTDLAEARGKQALFTRQSPQKLKVLREHALVESAISSNRIEGVEVDKSRIGTLIFGKPALRDRDEEEVRGYVLEPLLDLGLVERMPQSEWTLFTEHDKVRVSPCGGSSSTSSLGLEARHETVVNRPLRRGANAN
jgi:hypothetical protein